ncbi:unnamed protein product [Brassica napus]|uniref:(rape) hypothetical protein n=1 Tax=Brassica napus TaxID=3708 RepID=A0A816R783_BRANA|nr:unnamed protein product [Brassica napus]
MKLQTFFSTILLFFTTIFLLLSLPHSVSANQSNHTGFLQCLSLRLNDSNIRLKSHTHTQRLFLLLCPIFNYTKPDILLTRDGRRILLAIRGGGGSSFCVVLSWKAFWE